jgi:hypothetical protein
MSYIMREYRCPACGETFESLETRGAEDETKPHCDTAAPQVLSAVLGRIKLGEVSQGKNDQPPPPGCVSTQAIADGQQTGDWKLNRSRLRREKRLKTIRGMVS